MFYAPRKSRRAREVEFMTGLVEADAVSELLRAARLFESDEVAQLAKNLNAAFNGVRQGERLPVNIGLIVEDAIGVLLNAGGDALLPHGGVVAVDVSAAFGRLGGKLQPAIAAKLRWEKRLAMYESFVA